MSRPDKKQRHKAKREAKRHAARRQASISPVKRLADAKGETECWRSGDFQGMGQMQLWVHKRAAGLSGVACFLVDRGVVGLKDAFIKLRVDQMEFDAMLEGSASHGISMMRCTVEEVRRFVGGGLRWAHQNGMRQPKDWVKAASLFGGVGDWAHADVSVFAMEFAGHPEDLRRRLISEPFDEFIRRSDIDFVFADNAPVMDLRTGKYLNANNQDDDEDADVEDLLPEDEFNRMAEALLSTAIDLASRTTDWLAGKKESPSSELVSVWQSVLIAGLVSNTALPDAPKAEMHEMGQDLLEEMFLRIKDDREDEYRLALEQVNTHLEKNPDLIPDALEKRGSLSEPEGNSASRKSRWRRDK